MSTYSFSDDAIRDLDEICKYIARNNSSAASQLFDRIRERCKVVAGFPNMGKNYSQLSPSYSQMKLLDVVALIEDMPELGLYRGQVGTIVEVYKPNIFEVEYSDLNGRAYAIETLNANQLMLLHDQRLSE